MVSEYYASMLSRRLQELEDNAVETSASTFTMAVYEALTPLPIWSIMWDSALVGNAMVIVMDDGQKLSYEVGLVVAFISGDAECQMHICEYFSELKERCPAVRSETHRYGRDYAVVNLVSGDVKQYMIEENNHGIVPRRAEGQLSSYSWFLVWHSLHSDNCTHTLCVCEHSNDCTLDECRCYN